MGKGSGGALALAPGRVPRSLRGGFDHAALMMKEGVGAGYSLGVSPWSLIGVLSVSVIPLVSTQFSRFLLCHSF